VGAPVTIEGSSSTSFAILIIALMNSSRV
jgi:hypothetical protein